MRTTLSMAFATLFFFVAFIGCDIQPEATFEHNGVEYAQRGANKIFCGGIAGFECPEGMWCKLDGNYPDAGGTCKGSPAGDDCSLVRCIGPDSCPAGQTYHAPKGKDCCGSCKGPDKSVDEGYCETAADCDGLIHIMCVGSWSCDSNQCAYDCDVSTL